MHIKISSKRYTYLDKVSQRIGFFGVFLHFLVYVDIFFEEWVLKKLKV